MTRKRKREVKKAHPKKSKPRNTEIEDKAYERDKEELMEVKKARPKKSKPRNTEIEDKAYERDKKELMESFHIKEIAFRILKEELSDDICYLIMKNCFARLVQVIDNAYDSFWYVPYKGHLSNRFPSERRQFTIHDFKVGLYGAELCNALHTTFIDDEPCNKHYRCDKEEDVADIQLL